MGPPRNLLYEDTVPYPVTNPLDRRRVNLPAKSEVGDGNVVQDNAELLCPRGQLLKKKI